MPFFHLERDEPLKKEIKVNLHRINLVLIKARLFVFTFLYYSNSKRKYITKTNKNRVNNF